MTGPWQLMDPNDPRRELVCRFCGHGWGHHTWKGLCHGAEYTCMCRTSKGQPRRFEAGSSSAGRP